jgi:gamma-glutamyl:cysteine ligase YbdK (ATP-grasp superfamily)
MVMMQNRVEIKTSELALSASAPYTSARMLVFAATGMAVTRVGSMKNNPRNPAL